MSRDSASRTSPMRMRSGRIRRASLTRRRNSMAPVPSRFGWRHCMPTTSRSGTDSSKISSQVTTRSRGGIEAERQLSIVVLPDWVAPETRMFMPLSTAACSSEAAPALREFMRTRSGRRRARTTNLRMLMLVCLRVISGITACSREPSGREASTKGEERSRRRPEGLSMRSSRLLMARGLRCRPVSSLSPLRAMKISSGELIQISSTLSSSRKGWMTPKPQISSWSRWMTTLRSPTSGRETRVRFCSYSSKHSPMSARTASRSSRGSRLRRRMASRMFSSSRARCSILVFGTVFSIEIIRCCGVWWRYMQLCDCNLLLPSS